MSEAVAIDVLDQDVYNETCAAIGETLDKFENYDAAPMSVYLSLRIICKAMEDEMGINPVEISYKGDNDEAA